MVQAIKTRFEYFKSKKEEEENRGKEEGSRRRAEKSSLARFLGSSQNE